MNSSTLQILQRSVALLCVAPTLLTAATVDTFDGGGTAATNVQGGGGAAASVVAGGPNGNFLRLTTAGQNGTDNRYTYALTDTGAFDTITADFDFRILSPGADGFSFSLIPTSVFGTSGDGPAFTAEEPNFAGMLGIGFDLYDNLNNVSAHWNGNQLNELSVPRNGGPGVNFRENGVFNRVTAQLQRVGNGSNLTLTLTGNSLGTPGTPYKALEFALPNMLPYQNRVQFAGRTGGINQTVDIDNLNVAYSNPFTGLATAAPTGRLTQNFDSSGTTNYRAQQNNLRDDGTFRPGAILKAAEAGSSGAYLRLVSEIGSQNNQIAFDRAFDAGVSNVTEVLKFDARLTSSGTPADGMGILFLPTSTQGFSGAGIGSSEEPNHAGIFGVGLDVYNNGGGEQAPGISLHWNGVQVGDFAIPNPAIALGQFHSFEIVRTPVAGGLSVSVNITPDVNGTPGAPVSVVSNFFVAGARNYDNRVEFAARTGGASASHDLDNISSLQLAAAAQSKTHTNFDQGNGSGWKAFRSGEGSVPQIQNDSAPNGDYLRLMHDNNNQTNSVAFDQQSDGIVGSASGIVAEFDTRMTPGGNPGDGFSMMLIPTATYGTTGLGAITQGGFVSEEPNAPGVFGLAFDLYNGGSPFNEISLHWNGNAVTAGDPGFDLDSSLFHHVRLTLTESGSDVLASLSLIPDVFGSPGAQVNLFSDLLIPGMSLYDYRVEFGARSGGATVAVDLDNISVNTVPEPGSAAMLCLGLGVLLRRRRKLELREDH